MNRFDLYGALWLLCTRYHGGQNSRGYRILSRLDLAGYRPGLSLQQNRFESEEQRAMYYRLANALSRDRALRLARIAAEYPEAALEAAQI